MEIPETEWKSLKKIIVLQKIAFDSGSTNSIDLEKNTCDWQSMCYEKPLRFNIFLTEIFFKSGSLRVMKKYDESALMQILQEFGTP